MGDQDLRELSVRLSRMKIRWLMLVVAVVGIVLGGALWAWRWHQLIELKRGCVFEDIADLIEDYGDFSKVPLGQSAYLRDVAEPITLIKGPHEAASDDVWEGIVFTDGKQVERRAEYIITSYAPVEIHHSLMLGKETVPVRGPEERAFIGLLQRWYRHDAEARDFYNRLKRSNFSKLTEQQQAKVIGLAILRTLLKRN